jgi:hypothetical protein
MAATSLGKFGSMLERMSDRERNLVLGGLAVSAIVVVVLVGVLMSRKVSALDEEVTAGEIALREIEKQGPAYLANRAEEKATDDQLERAGKEQLQATVLNIAKTIEFERRDEDGTTSGKEKMSDVIKFANATDVLAELTQRKKGAPVKKQKKAKKGAKEVFMSTIDAVFTNVPEEALLRLLAKLEAHPDPLFGISLDITRTATSREQYSATIKIGQFRYGVMEE